MRALGSYLAVMLFGIASGWCVQGWHLGQQIATINNTHAESANMLASISLSQERQFNDTLQKAQQNATQRESLLQRSVNSANSELNGLRGDLITSRQNFAEATTPALADRARALTDVFEQCAERYTDLAQKADRHASDSQTLIDAWPTQSPPNTNRVSISTPAP